MSNADQYRELIESYALGALDPEDRAAVEAHLASGCAECGKALEESRWLVSQLAYLAAEAEPSDMLRGRLLKTVREEAATDSGKTRVPAKAVIPLWIWGAVAAALLFAVCNAWNTGRERAIIARLRQTIDEQIRVQKKAQKDLAVARREAEILTNPKSMKIPMPAGSKNMPALQAAWHQSMGLVVMGQKVPMPAGNRTLQLWLIPKAAGAKPMPSMTWRPEADGSFDMLVENPPGSPDDVKALAITEEPEGGSSQPTGTPIWVGPVAGQ